jgi:signal transduction histidine kinase
MTGFFDALYAAGHKSFDLQIERLIALLRIVLTTYCLAALITSFGLPSEITAPFVVILATYALFGLGVVLLPIIGKYRTGWQLPVHLIDIGVVSILTYFIHSVSAAFFILYVFVLMSATFRWNWRGALWTTLALSALQLIFLALQRPVTIAQFIVEWNFLLMIGGVFVFFGVSRERSAERLTQIAAWPDIGLQSYTDINWLDASLKHIATVLDAPRVLILWEIAQEPYWFSALLADGSCQHDRLSDSTFDKLVPTELEGVAFAAENAESRECLTLKGTVPISRPLVNEAIQARFNIASVCSAPFSGEYCKGRVFILDRSYWGDDDLAITEIVASRLHLELEYYALSAELRENAARWERIRLARDLHDGVLQTLTGAALQLSSATSYSGQELKHKLGGIKELLLTEQQRIRAFVEEHELSPRHQHPPLLDQIKRETERIERRWGCDVMLSVTPQDATVPVLLTHQIELLLAESAANAVQHGAASRINVAVESASNTIQLRITDNGRGLPGAKGTYDQSELAARHIGPRSISKRVAELGGTLSLSTSSTGVALCIELPSGRTAQKPNEQAPAFG